MRQEFRHEPIMEPEIVAALTPALGGVHVDLTVGGGGHLAAVAAAGVDGSYIGMDRDREALSWCRRRFAGNPAVQILESRWSEWGATLDKASGSGRVVKVSSGLIDCGVSSVQIDEAERGFSFRREGPLDMRMSSDGPTALELLHSWTWQQLADVLRRYGEVPAHRRVAKAIRDEVEAGRIETTLDLAEVCAAATPQKVRRGGGHPAALVFQALRIAVNEELQELSSALDQFEDRLEPGGRLAILTFHSLEDRIVKRRFSAWTKPALPPPGVAVPESLLKADYSWVIRRQGASPAEVEANPRSRSAWLRVVQRQEAE